MNTLEAIKTRRSVRSFKADPVPEDLLKQVLEAGTWAATGMNRQSPIILAFTTKEERDKVMRMNMAVLGPDRGKTDPFYGAPVVIAVLADASVPTHVQDGALVLGNMMLAATELGLASCYIFRAKEEFASDEGKAILAKLGIEGDYEGVAHIALGYAEGAIPEPKPRKENWIYCL